MTPLQRLSLPLVTRVEVIDPHSGRAFVGLYEEPGASVHVQDEGRTVKVFAAEQQGPVAHPLDEIREVVAEAFGELPACLDNPEGGGSGIDVITDHLFRYLNTRKG